MGLLTPKTRAFHRIGDRYATLFDADHFLGRSAFEDSWISKPPTNVKKKENLVSLEIAMPGFKKEEVFVEVKNDTLHIYAEKKTSDENYVEKEVPNKITPQVIRLAPDVDQDKIAAHLENGMLYVELPRAQNPGHSARHISVK